jgi:hypothetical protein
LQARGKRSKFGLSSKSMPVQTMSIGGLSLERAKLGFLDIIFGVIIGISFTDYKDLMVPLSFSFETATLLLAYVIVFRAWIGYHYYLAKLTAEDKPRFIPSNVVFGLISLYLYFYLLESIRDFSTVVLMMPIIAGFGAISSFILVFTRTDDYLKGLKDYPKLSFIDFARYALKSFEYVSIFIVQAIVYYFLIGYFQSPTLAGAPLLNWCILATSFLIYLVPVLISAIFPSKHGEIQAKP